MLAFRHPLQLTKSRISLVKRLKRYRFSLSLFLKIKAFEELFYFESST